jgi:hypothetical protein
VISFYEKLIKNRKIMKKIIERTLRVLSF